MTPYGYWDIWVFGNKNLEMQIFVKFVPYGVKYLMISGADLGLSHSKNKWVRVLAQKLISEFRKLRSKEYHTLSSTKISGFYRDFIKITHIYCYSLGCAFRVNPGQFWAEQIRVSWRSPWPKIFEKIKKSMFGLDKQRNSIVRQFGRD